MKKSILFFLFLIFIVAGFLRLYRISTIPPGLYVDEVSIGLNAYEVLTTGRDQYGVPHPLIFRSLDDYKVPGYIYMVAGSMIIFGKNEFAIRFPSAFFGTLTVLVVFFLLRELLILHPKTKKHADFISLAGAGILAITPWHLHFSRGGFEATVGLFFYLLGIFCALKFFVSKKSWYILFTSLLFLVALYTYDAYRILVPLTTVVGFFAFVTDKEKRNTIIMSAFLLGILAFPLFVVSLTAQGQARFSATSAFFENPYSRGILKIPGDMVIFTRNYLSYFSITYLFRFGDQINRHQVNDLGILYVWQLPFILAGIYFLTKTSNKLLRFMVFLLLFVGITAPAIGRPSPHSLRFLQGSIPYAFLTVIGIGQLINQKTKWIRYSLIAIGVFAVLETGYYFNYYYINYPKEALIDWGGACKETALIMKNESKNFQHIVIDKNIACIKEYFLFYTPGVKETYVNTSWTKPQQWGKEKVLYVRPFYGKKYPENLIENVYLPNNNHDVFAQLLIL